MVRCWWCGCVVEKLCPAIFLVGVVGGPWDRRPGPAGCLELSDPFVFGTHVPGESSLTLSFLDRGSGWMCHSLHSSDRTLH
ncbi:uncharacterized protein B0T23DRAFT_383258 [Neurospora hispaniola]|uniref:Secreted protein n=1 Tax=Neurospora hispaniola TaxID=588809 RepID=A0AAJ0MQX1_9PEZI|nr:hypothetical protein B0T23DRAFT_383258 [Neurospora hispaniola]